ncbi:MAG: hypothetical protein BZY79_02440 [SAR202 cluster bacterium Casp-Chloro-G4]|nr:nucleoside hydrolase [Chloroflexota bacterium]MDA1228006.1 nucleoside hydrolase [Chloroflexota bacterium]PKB61689.1 MAG: hypothetical protein BZY79_02440 [SAR202 cluster bacterium Casp-Chloro-G4]
MKVLIDTDPGTDDALALILALNSPALEILGLTTVAGNASLALTTRNALRILEYMGHPDIPVYRGASRPLKGHFTYAYYYHGPAGLTVRLPTPKSKPSAVAARQAIVDSAKAYPGELTLIALGPLTNVARAIQDEPALPELLKEIYVMGGAVNVPGNVTPYAEFNIYDDAEAANVVFSSDAKITLVGLDVCHEPSVLRDDAEWFSGKSLGEKLVARIIRNWFKMRPDDDRYNLCDPLTVLASLRPELFTYKQASVQVETQGERLGETTAEFGSGRVRVAVDIDVAAAKDGVLAGLG